MLSEKVRHVKSESPPPKKGSINVLVTYTHSPVHHTSITKIKNKRKHCNIKQTEYKYCTSKQHLVPSALLLSLVRGICAVTLNSYCFNLTYLKLQM